MNSTVLIFAATTLPLPPPGSSQESHALEILAIVGGAGLVFLAGIIWAVYFRKHHRHRHHHHHHHHHHGEGEAAEPSLPAPEPPAEVEPRRHRHRRRRREHRHRNPTLAETGGLPPVRQEPPETTP